MFESKLSKIYVKNTTYDEVKPCDLLRSNIRPTDIDALDEVTEFQRKRHVLLVVSAIGFAILCAIGFYITLITLDYSDITTVVKEIFLMLGLTLGFSAFAIFFYKKLVCLINKDYKRIQYGIIQSKYIIRDSSGDSGTNYYYYINVIFPDTNTYIRKVICNNEKLYNSLNEGDETLVLSFDNKEAYAVNIN